MNEIYKVTQNRIANFRLTSGENSGVNQLFQYDMVLLTKIKKLDQVNPKLILLTGILLFELNL